MNAAFIMNPEQEKIAYPYDIKKEVYKICDVLMEGVLPSQLSTSKDITQKIQILFTGRGAPLLDEAFLTLFPNLEVVFYAGGSIKPFVTDVAWEHGVRIASAWKANATPVAEFTFAQIILGLKQVQRISQLYKNQKKKSLPTYLYGGGAFKSAVGLISLGEIGKKVAQMLRDLDVNVFAYDPHILKKDAQDLGVTLTSLEDCFERCRVVSLHPPLLPQTRGLINKTLMDKMPVGGVLINTSRGAIIQEDELIEVLSKRPDLLAILDVTDPEPPQPDSKLFDLENAILTPHIAGSVFGENARMGQMMLDECRRYLKGEPLVGEIDSDMVKHMA